MSAMWKNILMKNESKYMKMKKENEEEINENVIWYEILLYEIINVCIEMIKYY